MYPKLFLKNYRLYILIFFFTFFTRLPVILLFDFTDPGSDSIYYINFAENLLSNQKYQLDFVKPGFSMDDIHNLNVISLPYVHYGFSVHPGYAIFLSLIFIFDNDISTIILVNTILFSFLSLFAYNFYCKFLSQRLSLLTTLVFVFNPYFYIWSTHIYTEILYILLIFISLNLLFDSNGAISDIKSKIILSGLFSALAFITRFPFIFIFLGILLYSYLNGKNKVLKYYSLSFFAFISPLIIRNFSHYFGQYGNLVNAQNNGSVNNNSIIDISLILDPIRYVLYTAEDISSLNFLFLLAPFALIGILTKFESKWRPIIYMIIITVLGHLVITSILGRLINYRYFVVLYPLILPISIITLDDFSNKYGKLKLAFITRSCTITSVLISIIIISSSVSLVSDFKEKASFPQHNSGNYSWIIEDSNSEDIVLSFSPHRTYYFTNLNCIYFIPQISSNETFDLLISQYNISYIVIEEEYFTNNLEMNYYVLDLFDIDNEIILTDNYRIVKEYTDDESGASIWFYKIESIN